LHDEYGGMATASQSPSSEISILFESSGQRRHEDSEPEHAGISHLEGAISLLEAQYLMYRTNFRKTDSVHRLQAAYVENQLLNMLGIRGLTLDSLSTETVPDAANLVQAELSARQYENVFENIGSF